MIKLFPQLGTDNEVTLDDILESCKDGKKKILESIMNYEFQLRINQKLMDLKNPSIPDEAKEEIKSVLLEPKKSFNSQQFLDLYHEDELANAIPNVNMWLFNNFNELQKYK